MSSGYRLRTCYVNFAEHLQNAWNVNFLYHDAPGTWTDTDWRAFIQEIKAFGFNNFQFWIPSTMVVPGKAREEGTEKFKRIIRYCHEEEITANALITVNTMGAEWYFACPNDLKDRAKILEFWTYFAENLEGCDYFTIFPGDPGGCNRNGCDHNTYLTLSAEIAHMIKKKQPAATVEVGTWGTPFTGWGGDMRTVPDWDGTFAMLADPDYDSPEVPCHIWNGSEERAFTAMEDMMKSLPSFPEDTIFSFNSGFNPDCEPVGAYDARPWAKKVAETHRINSWDYAASEGELICYPHYRVGKYRRKRLMEVENAPYFGAICYTMSPKLSLLMLYSAAQLMIDPTRETKEITSEFSALVFDDPKIGPLMEAFEIVPGWGYEENPHSKESLKAMLSELIERLKKAKGKECKLPLYPSAEEYRKDLLWHAENFLEMLGENPDREAIRKRYWERALAIYDAVPQAVDERSQLSASGYSKIGM